MRRVFAELNTTLWFGSLDSGADQIGIHEHLGIHEQLGIHEHKSSGWGGWEGRAGAGLGSIVCVCVRVCVCVAVKSSSRAWVGVMCRIMGRPLLRVLMMILRFKSF
jgi:hypothetical protein